MDYFHHFLRTIPGVLLSGMKPMYIVFALRVLKKWKVIQQLARRSSCSVNHHHRLLLPQLRFFYQLDAVPFLGVPAIP